MVLIHRPVFFRLGRLEVFAERRGREAGWPLVQVQREESKVCATLHIWVGGFHLIVCSLKGPQEVANV